MKDLSLDTRPYIDFTDPEHRSARSFLKESSSIFWKAAGLIMPEPLAQALIQHLAIDRVDNNLGEIQKRLPHQIRNQITIQVNGEMINLGQWYATYLDGTKTNRKKEAAYTHQDGKLYRLLPKEVEMLLLMLANIEATSAESFAEQLNAMLAHSRKKLVLSIGGVSVGGEILCGILKRFPFFDVRIADPKSLSTVNGNRMSHSIKNEGVSKVEIRRGELHASTPWIHVTTFPKGLDDTNQTKFLNGTWLYIDEMDSIVQKVNSRKAARQQEVNAAMFSDVQPNILMEYRPFNTKSVPLFARVDDQVIEAATLKADEALKRGDQDTAKKAFTSLVPLILGAENIPPDFATHLALVAQGELGVIPQPRETVLYATILGIQLVETLLHNEEPQEFAAFSLPNVRS